MEGLTPKYCEVGSDYVKVFFKQERPFKNNDYEFFAKEVSKEHNINVDKDNISIVNEGDLNGLEAKNN